MNNSKLTLSDVIIEYQENGKYFDKGRIIFGLYDRRLTMFDRQSEIEKVNNYKEIVCIHLIMILFPARGWDNELNEKNKSDVVNKWMIPAFNAMVDANLYSKHLDTDFGDKDSRRIAQILRDKHDYRERRRDDAEIEFIYGNYLGYLSDLIFILRKKHRRPTKEEYYGVFNYIKNKYDKLIK